MNTVKSLWSMVQGDPALMRRVNGWLTIAWIIMIPISIATGWIHSVAYISALSLWALVSGHWSAWQAARVEVAQQREQEERANDPIEQRVVRAIVEETTVDAVEAAEAASAATGGPAPSVSTS
jgi:hypothetical protein